MILFHAGRSKDPNFLRSSFITIHSSIFVLEVMLFNVSPLLLFTSLACSAVADSSVPAKSSIESSDLPLLNIPQVYNVTPISNISEVRTLPIPLPYGFSVPNTEVHLRLGFGLPRHRLNPMDMSGLIAVIQHIISEGIENHGEGAYPGVNFFGGSQKFRYTLGDGIDFLVWNVRHSGEYFTWGQLQNVVEGLRLYLVVGERYYATAFNFWDGPGRWRHPNLGGGQLWFTDPLDHSLDLEV